MSSKTRQSTVWGPALVLHRLDFGHPRVAALTAFLNSDKSANRHGCNELKRQAAPEELAIQSMVRKAINSTVRCQTSGSYSLSSDSYPCQSAASALRSGHASIL